MKKDLKFFSIMSALDENEVAGFGEYLHWRYGREANALKVFDYYSRFFPKKKRANKMSAPYAFPKIYGRAMEDEEKDSKKLWNDLSKLNQWLKEFLVLEKVRNDNDAVEATWLDVLFDKGLTRQHFKNTVKAKKKRSAEYFLDMETCLQQLDILLHERRRITNERAEPDRRTLALCVLEIKKRADLIVKKMQCEYLSLKVAATDDETSSKSQPLLHLYEEILLLYTTLDEQHYRAIEQLLQKFGNQIADNELVLILRHVQNYISIKVAQTNSLPWGKSYHKMNKMLLENGGFLFQGSMSAINYQNIINAACAVSETEWASVFANRYANYLPEKIREQSLTLANAFIAFELKDFNKVVELLKGRSKFKGDSDKVRSKMLQLCARFELGIDVYEMCDAYTNYLIRHHKNEAGPWPRVIAFMKIFTALAQGYLSKDELDALLKANQQISMRTWLERKVREYKG